MAMIELRARLRSTSVILNINPTKWCVRQLIAVLHLTLAACAAAPRFSDAAFLALRSRLSLLDAPDVGGTLGGVPGVLLLGRLPPVPLDVAFRGLLCRALTIQLFTHLPSRTPQRLRWRSAPRWRAA